MWLERARLLGRSPSVAFIAAVGSVLLAKATDDRVNSYVIKQREGSGQAYSLRSAATVLALKQHQYGYDIGSSSVRDPINHSTLNGATRWDIALERITRAHKPFFQVILSWLSDIEIMSRDEALRALAAYIRVRSEVVSGAAAEQVPPSVAQPPRLGELVDALEGFSSADAERGARGMALVAACYRCAGFAAEVPSRNDPRRIDVPIKRDGVLVIGSEVKQQPASSAIVDSLVRDGIEAGVDRVLLAVLRPGRLEAVDRVAEVRRAERRGVVLRIVENVRELVHESLVASDATVNAFCAAMPRAYADALREIRVGDDTVTAWVAISRQWA